jgi:hypothetical protein
MVFICVKVIQAIMFFWSLQITIISIIMIFLVHHLLNFFKNTLTVPKVKDLVNIPQQKYENIYNVLNKRGQHNANNYLNSIDEIKTINNNEVKQETKIEINSMKNELKNFLKKQLNQNNNNQGNTTNIETFDFISNNNYSLY